MAHVAKYTKAACGHMFAHYERAKDINGEYLKFGNENIDTTKTDSNYNLAPDRGMNQGAYVKQRCSEVQCLKRKDVNVMCSWVVTAPKGLPKEQEREFFEQTYKFLENRYGEKNVVSAHVHLDEVQPHMHFAFVPVVYDKKKGVEKVSAKEKVCKSDLQTFHADLEKALERHFGKEVGILNEVTKEGNKSIEELKRGTAQEELQTIKDTIKDLQDKIGSLKQAREAYKGELERLQDSLKRAEDVQATYRQIDSIEGKTGMLNKDKVTISVDDFEKIKDVAKKVTSLEYKIDELQGELQRVRHREDRLENLGLKLKEENQALRGQNKTLDNKIKVYNRIFKKGGLDEEKLQKVLNATQKEMLAEDKAKNLEMSKIRHKGMGMER